MSTSAFVQISTRLKELLKAAMDGIGPPAPTIELRDPSQDVSGDWISLWLYDAQVDEFCRNGRAGGFQIENGGGKGAFRYLPLPVNLYYLITPMITSPVLAQQALAQIMLALHENALLSVIEPEEEVNTQISVTLSSEEMDDRLKLWEALNKPYRLSVAYVVRKASLVSKQVESTKPILETLPQ